MRMVLVRGFLALIAAGTLATGARADDWTSPRDVSRSAHEFATTAEQLQAAIKDVDAESPLVAEVGTLARSATRFHDSVAKGATYQDATKDFGKIEGGYTHFESALKKAHDVHHEPPVAAAGKKFKATFDRLQAHMTGRRPPENPTQATPPRTQENPR